MKRDWQIGQYADMTVRVDAPAAWKQNMTYAWDVPGNILRGYEHDLIGQTIPVVDDEAFALPTGGSQHIG